MEINHEDYIDVNDALKRLGGNMNLYKRLLGQFIAGNHIEPLEEALKNGAKDDASRLVHTLKGLAANLSLVKLRAFSTELEHQVTDDTDYTETLAELKQAYDVTAQVIADLP